MQRRGKQSEIHKIDILQMPMWKAEASKVKYIEIRYCSCQYAEKRKENSNIQNANTADVNMQG